jgi:hypothetical protein
MSRAWSGSDQLLNTCPSHGLLKKSARRLGSHGVGGVMPAIAIERASMGESWSVSDQLFNTSPHEDTWWALKNRTAGQDATNYSTLLP